MMKIMRFSHFGPLACFLGLFAAPTRAQQRPLVPIPRQGELPSVRAEATAPDKYFDWLPLKPQC
jgi:hypothetical protein